MKTFAFVGDTAARPHANINKGGKRIGKKKFPQFITAGI